MNREHHMKISKIVLFMMMLYALSETKAIAENILVIVNPGVTATAIDSSTVSTIYQAKKSKWDSGESINVAMLKSGPVHEKFVKDIVDITPKNLLRIWRKVIFTGLGNPPNIFKTEKDLVNFVAETNGAIGYINASTPHKNVKVASLAEQ